MDSFERLKELHLLYNLQKVSTHPLFLTLSPSEEGHIHTSQSVKETSGEKLGHDLNSDTWFYEKWDLDSTLKLWQDPVKEWGEVLRPGQTEKWFILDNECEFEHFDASEGLKVGRKEDMMWSEKWYKKEGEYLVEKQWNKPQRSWGSKEGIYMGRTWTEEWTEEEDFKETSSKNIEGENEWGECKGQKNSSKWQEVWSKRPHFYQSDKWCEDGAKKWGIKVTKEGLTSYIEEWEENGSERKEKKTFDDGHGHKNMVVEGWGETYRHKDTLEEDVAAGHIREVKEGNNEDREWWTEIKKDPGYNYVHNWGKNQYGSWEETWHEDSHVKWAHKKGSDLLYGAWEENWKEEDGIKECKKWGEKDEKWWEEWKEGNDFKWCRKEQHKGGSIHVQEWNETYEEESMHTKGHFYVDGAVIKEWDATNRF